MAKAAYQGALALQVDELEPVGQGSRTVREAAPTAEPPVEFVKERRAI